MLTNSSGALEDDLHYKITRFAAILQESTAIHEKAIRDRREIVMMAAERVGGS
jgi:hypothetical protein